MPVFRCLPALAGALATVWLLGSLQAATVSVSTLSANPSAGEANAAAINSAIASAQSGDRVQLPSGTYAIASTIELKSGVNVIGAGQAQTALQYAGTTSTPMISDDGASNLRLAGFTLDGANNAAAAEGIDAQSCSGLNIQCVTVENLTLNSTPNAELGPHGIYFSGSVTNSVISGSTFKEIGTNSNWGAGIRLSAGSNDNQVLNNTVADTGRGGILLNNCSGNTIIGNRVTGSGQSTAGLGIEIQGCPNSLIQNNTVDHWVSVDTSSGSAVRGNTISDTSGTFKYAGLELVDSQNVVFSRNTVNGGANIGISISGSGGTSKNIYFGHNSVSGANTWGAQLQGDSGGASELYFEGNTFSGTTNGPNAPYGSAGVGFRFNGDAHFITLDNTKIDGNAYVGVQVSKGSDNNLGNLTFNNTTITNNGDVGISQDGGIPDVQWNGTIVAGNNYSNAVPAPTDPTHPQPQPTVIINAPTILAEGQTGTFAAEFVEADGTLGSVLWDFGDGLPSTSQTSTHSFALPGVYNVAVVAWDSTGYASEAELDVTVTPEPLSGCLYVGVLLLLHQRPGRRGDGQTELVCAEDALVE